MFQLSIRAKLISSYIIIGTLVAILSIFSIFGINESSKNYDRYREIAKDTVLASRIQANMLMVRMNFKDYHKTLSQKDIEEFNYYYIRTEKFISQATIDIQKPERVEMVREIKENFKQYKKDFLQVVAYMNTRNDIVLNNLDIHGKKIEQLLTSVSKGAYKDKDLEAVVAVDSGLRNLLLARLYTAKYLASNEQKDANRANLEFEYLKLKLINIDKEIQDEERSQSLSQARDFIDIYKEGVSNIIVLIRDRNRIIDEGLNVIGPNIATLAEDLKLSIKKEQDEIGPNVVTLNESLLQSSILVSIFVIFFVLLVSYILPKSIRDSLAQLHGGVKDLLTTDTTLKKITVSSHDEIAEISQDFNKYIQIVEDKSKEDALLIGQASLVANGDYSVIIKPRNAEDILGNTLERITVNLKEFANIALNISNGNIKVKATVKNDNDVLALSVNKMVETLQSLTEHANRLSNEDYSQNIVPKSNEDILGISLQNMTSNLKNIYEETQIREWTQEGQRKVNNVLRDDKEVDILSQELLSLLAEYLRASVGTLYKKVESEDKQHLELSASYAYSKEKIDISTIEFGEGIVGQVAKDKEILLLEDLPDSYMMVNSSLGESSPKNLLVIPFMFRSSLRGVIELGFTQKVDEKTRKLIQSIVDNIGIAFENVSNKKRLNIALNKAQSISEELQSQEEELRTSNEQLITQSDVLKVQKEDLEKSSVELNEKAVALEDASRYKSEFLANMSHELRTPLNSLLILSQSLAENDDNNLSEDEVESAQVIQDSGKHLLSLINDILDISKVEAGQMVVSQDKVYLKELQTELSKRFTHMAKDKNISFSVEADEGLPSSIVSDKAKLAQILTNLISNALKFTGTGGVILHMGIDGERLAFSIIDTGIGIPKDKQSTIFEAFKQADGSTTRNFGGTGLGLSISLSFAQLLDGGITVESEVNKGSTFTLSIPYKMSDTVATEEVLEHSITKLNKELVLSAPLFEDDRENIDSDKTLFLIIEDDSKFAKILYNNCLKDGNQAIVAQDGESGILLAREYEVDGIILDYMLPGYDGGDVLSLLKNDVRTKDIPVHIISALDNLIDMKQLGAIGQLKKPVSQEQIKTVLGQLAEHTQDNSLEVLIVKNENDNIESLESLLLEESVETVISHSQDEVLENLKHKHFSAMILDISKDDGVELLETITNDSSIEIPPLIIYTDKELSDEMYQKVQQYSQNIVVKSSASNERILDEVKLFESHINDRTTDSVQAKEEQTSIDLESKNVLLVDDDMRNTYSLAKILRKKKMTVEIASSGLKALETLDANNTIDIILMDIMMPGMDGYETMQEIRKRSEFVKTPIIALTANAMKGDKEKCLEAGADDYLSKPIDVEKLLTMMHMCL